MDDGLEHEDWTEDKLIALDKAVVTVNLRHHSPENVFWSEEVDDMRGDVGLEAKKQVISARLVDKITSALARRTRTGYIGKMTSVMHEDFTGVPYGVLAISCEELASIGEEVGMKLGVDEESSIGESALDRTDSLRKWNEFLWEVLNLVKEGVGRFLGSQEWASWELENYPGYSQRLVFRHRFNEEGGLVCSLVASVVEEG